MSGGWRFPFDRQTSTASLYQPQGIDPEFLKRVAALEQQAPKGLIDAAVSARPLQGLLDAPGGAGGQDFGGNGQPGAGASYGMTPGGNTAKDVNGWGFSPSMSGAGKGFASGGLLGAILGGATGGNVMAPVQDLVAPGLNGYNQQNYGASPTEVGAPTEAQAKALADELAKSLAQYETGGGLLGGGGYSVGGIDYGNDAMDYGG